MIATVLAGTLSPLQSAVNGALGATVGDGNVAAVVSFGSGLLLMGTLVTATPRLRASVQRLLRGTPSGTPKRLKPWNYLAGLCGAAVVLSEGISVGPLGVAVFQLCLVCGMIVSGVACDRFGVTGTVAVPLSAARLTGAALAMVATAVAVSTNLHAPHMIVLTALPFIAGLSAGWQPAGNAAVARECGSAIVAITVNFTVGFVVLALGLTVRLLSGTTHITLPSTWWMYTGGILGLTCIGSATVLVRGLGLLLLGLAGTAGQLLGALASNDVMPGVTGPIAPTAVVGTVIALAAAGIAAITGRNAEPMTR